MLPAYKETYTHYTTPSGNTQLILYRRKSTQKHIKISKYFINQKALGIILVVLGIVGCAIFQEDNGGFAFTVLLGILRIIY